MSKYLSIKETCLYLGVSRDTLQTLIRDKNLPFHLVGKRKKFLVHEIDKWVLRKAPPH